MTTKDAKEIRESIQQQQDRIREGQEKVLKMLEDESKKLFITSLKEKV